MSRPAREGILQTLCKFEVKRRGITILGQDEMTVRS